jgi:hypothetical protein
MINSSMHPKLLLQIRRRHSAHFALLSPLGSNPERPLVAAFDQLTTDLALAAELIVHTRATQSGLEIVDAMRGGQSVEFGTLWTTDADFRTALENALPAIVLVEGFEQLPIASQLDWLARFRAFRERAPKPFQLIIGDAWRARAALAEWKLTRSHLSPPLNTNNIHWSVGYSLQEVEHLMGPFVQRTTDFVARALTELAYEQTAGDRRFVDLLIESLDESFSDVGVERAIFELPEHSTAADPVLAALEDLSISARQKLAACVRAGIITLDDGDPDAEMLSLYALLRRSKRTSNRWQLASPVVASVLRRYPQRLDLPTRNFDLNSELLPLRHPTGAHANLLVSEIECLLRNLVVTTLAVADNCHHPLQAVPRTAERDVYAIASGRREADSRASLVKFVRQPLSAHLDVAHLSEIITDAELHRLFFSEFFPDRNEFTTHFQAFNELRKAVAHNKLSSVRVLDELSKLLDYFETGLAHAARAAANQEAPASLVKVDTETIRVLPPLQTKKLVVEVDLVNCTNSSLHGVAAIATFLDESRRPCHPELRILDLTFKSQERRRIRLEGKLDPKAPEQLPRPEITLSAAKRSRHGDPPSRG